MASPRRDGQASCAAPWPDGASASAGLEASEFFDMAGGNSECGPFRDDLYGVTSIGSETAMNTNNVIARAPFLAISGRGLLNDAHDVIDQNRSPAIID
jgi:hypothetical protein